MNLSAILSLVTIVAATAAVSSVYAEDNLVIRKSFQSTASENPTNWKEIKFDSNDYCSPGWLGQLRSQEGYGRYLEYHDPTFNPYLATEITYWRTNASDYVFGPAESSTEVFHPRIKCNWTLGKSIEFSNYPNPAYSAEKGVLNMESDATYFNASRGPKIDVIIDLFADVGESLEVKIEYLDDFGRWKTSTIKRINIINTNLSSTTVSTTLPYPTFARVKLLNPAPIDPYGDIRVRSVRFFAEECVPNQNVPGQCL